jgi:hypothetical protein
LAAIPYWQVSPVGGVAGVVAGAVAGVVAGVVAGDVADVVEGVVAGVVAGDVADAVAGDVADAVADAVAGDVSDGVADAVADAVAGDVSDGVADAVAGDPIDPYGATTLEGNWLHFLPDIVIPYGHIVTVVHTPPINCFILYSVLLQTIGGGYMTLFIDVLNALSDIYKIINIIIINIIIQATIIPHNAPFFIL